MKGQDTFASTWHSDLRESELPNAEARKAACPSSLRSGAMKVQLGFLQARRCWSKKLKHMTQQQPLKIT